MRAQVLGSLIAALTFLSCQNAIISEPTADAGVAHSDAGTVRPDASLPDAEAVRPDASLADADAEAVRPDASLADAEAESTDASLPDAEAESPDASLPDAEAESPDTSFADAEAVRPDAGSLELIPNAKYVSIAGSDSNSGTALSPWRTIQHGVSRLAAGDTLYVRGGVYFETVWVGSSGTADAPIQIFAYPGELPVIDGSGLQVRNWDTLLSVDGDYVHASGFELRNINMDGAREGGYGLQMVGLADTASNMIVHHTWAQGMLAQGDFNVIEDSHVWQVAYANCRTAGCDGATRYPRGGWPSCVSAARDPKGDSITDHAILRRNIVHDCWGEGISSFEADGTIFEDNAVYDNWAMNIYLSDTPNARVQRNLVYNSPNNIVGKKMGLTLADERADKPRSINNVVINNLIYRADLCAFCWTEVPGSGLDHVLVANNTVVDGELSTGTVNIESLIVNNIILGSASIPTASGLTFSHNLWASERPSAAAGPGDVLGDPKISRAGGTGPGVLSGEYFKLTPGSPAIGAGLVLPEVPTDFFGTLRGNPSDIGGHQL